MMNDALNTFITNIHFIRPLWLLAILGLFIALILLKRYRYNQSPWQQFLPPHLTKVLLESSQNGQATKQSSLLLKPFIIGLFTIIALAGPTWQKLPQPVYQIEKGAVLIMDMSYSMYANDLKPNRLTRARYKAIDLLASINEGDIGLIAYAGDAFIISPLTKDIKNIELLLPSLTPEIMPVLGSNPLAALTLAHEMLINSGHIKGDIYWFTDGIDNEDLIDIHHWSSDFGHKLNILGIGTANGAPIKLPSGELLKDDDGRIVVPKLPQQRLASVALRSQGRYQTITNNENDIDALTSIKTETSPHSQSEQKEDEDKFQTGDQWKEEGPWLIFIILPLLLSYFRRGTALLVIPLIASLTLLPAMFFSTVSYAASKDEIKTPIEPSSTAQKLWQNLWETKDQQGQQKFNNKAFKDAANTFEDPLWQGSSHYKAGDYQQALNSFKQGNTSEALYNQGNALAQLQQYDEAIKTYKQALKLDPNLNDAKENIAKIEELKKQQEQQNKEDQNNENKEQQGDKQENEQSKEQNKQDDQQGKPQDNKQKENNAGDEQSQDQKNKNAQDKQNNNKKNSDKDKDNEKNKEQDQQQKKNDDEKSKQETKSVAQINAEKKDKETQQKHQQLLNKVTDDPYLLLRNKMQLEYQKRKQENNRQGAQKKW